MKTYRLPPDNKDASLAFTLYVELDSYYENALDDDEKHLHSPNKTPDNFSSIVIFFGLLSCDKHDLLRQLNLPLQLFRPYLSDYLTLFLARAFIFVYIMRLSWRDFNPLSLGDNKTV
jgi:hypothetical protein